MHEQWKQINAHYCYITRVQRYNNLEDVIDDTLRGPLANSMNPHLTEYEKMVTKLDNFFAQKRGPHYEQYIFSLMMQNESNSLQYV